MAWRQLTLLLQVHKHWTTQTQKTQNNIIQITGQHVETLHYSPTYYTIELCVTNWLSWLILLAYCN